jgi:DNA-binding transcriptional LysR family regulator
MEQVFDWDLLRSFLAVARTGKLTTAARKLKIDHSTLGRRISALEADLDTKLFDRTLSGYALTLQGEKLLARAEEVESSVFAIQADVDRDNSQISGTIRIGSPDGFGTAFLAPCISDLSLRQPFLDIELVAIPRNLSLSKREADVVIGLSRPTYGRLHARKLTDYELGIYGRAGDDQVHGRIKTVDDLASQPFISYIEDLIFAPELDYLPLISKAIKPHFRSSNLIAQKEAVAAGAGLCVLPCFLADADSRLVRVLANDVQLIRTFWMIVHSDVRDLARIRVTTDFIAAAVAAAGHRFLPTRS